MSLGLENPEKQASVIIAWYNGARYLEPCLSALERNCGDDCEIIVVDNASNDESADLIERFYPQVTVIRNERNRGFAAACNQGARIARGQVLVFLNQDTRVEPHWLDALVRGLDGDGPVAMTTSKILLMRQPDRIQLCGQDVHYTGLVFSRHFCAPRDTALSTETVSAVSGASFAVRRDVWEALGGFDETFFMYYEETDFSWRAQLVGYACLCVPDSVLYHDYRLGRPSASSLYFRARNRWVVLIKNWKWATLLLMAPSLLLAELLDWILATAYGWEGIGAKTHAILWLVGHLWNLYRLHIEAQIGRKVSDAAILESRPYRLEPMVITGGRVGRVVTRMCNVFFAVLYRLTYLACQKLGL